MRTCLLGIIGVTLTLLFVSCATPTTTFVNNSTHDVIISGEVPIGDEYIWTSSVVSAGDSLSIQVKKPEYSFPLWVRRMVKEEGKVVFLDKTTTEFHFLNNTIFYINIEDANGQDFDPFVLAPGESRLVKTISIQDTYKIEPQELIKPYYVDHEIKKGQNVVINQWIPAIEYIVTGTTTHVDISHLNSMGETVQLSNVELPYHKVYKSFPGSSMYITAKNRKNYGDITVSIYKDGELYSTSTTGSPYGNTSTRGVNR